MLDNLTKVSINVDVKDDGVYLVINRPIGEKNKLDLSAVKSIIDLHGVQDWDFNIVNAALSNMNEHVSVRISLNTNLKKVDESAKVFVSSDKMSASMTLYKARNGGKPITLEEIKATLTESGVVHGIDEDILEQMLDFKEYGVLMQVAEGQPAEHGRNGTVQFHFNTGKRSYAPKLLENGKVDYFDLDLFDVASKGMVVATIIPPTDGVNGQNVFGEIVPALRGKPVSIPKGKNVHIGEDGVSLIADIDGQIIFTAGKVNIEPVLEIRQDVDNSTGNINFLGSVVVRGNVLTGFSVYATGNVEVNGVVEGASVHSDGDIVIKSGVQGIGKGKITTGGTMSSKFIENCRIIAYGDINADAIMHSHVKCSGSLTLSGKRGLLVGGKIKVLQQLHAYTIGSHMATSTEIQVGIDPDTYEQYKGMKEEYEGMKKELAKVDLIIDALAKLKQAGQLTAEKRTVLVKSLQTKKFTKGKMEELQMKIEKVLPALVKGNGIIKASKIIHPGVKIIIGNATMFVREPIQNCTVYNKGGDIKIGPY